MPAKKNYQPASQRLGYARGPRGENRRVYLVLRDNLLTCPRCDTPLRRGMLLAMTSRKGQRAPALTCSDCMPIRIG